MYNIKKIKNELSNHTNAVVKVISYGNRNKVDECFGILDKLYNNIFTIRQFDNSIKSFTYRDILIRNIKVCFEKVSN